MFVCIWAYSLCVEYGICVYMCVCMCSECICLDRKGFACGVCMYEYVCGVCSCVHVCLVRCTSLCVVVYAVCGMIIGSHHSEHVGIRGQLSGVTSLFLP